MMALRAAKNAGVFVRKNVIDDGVAYIKACQMPDGGFSYFKGGVFRVRSQRGAIVGLYSAGIYTGRDIEKGLRYVNQYLPVRQFAHREIPPQHYYYGHYYAALAMWTAGGEWWSQWFPQSGTNSCSAPAVESGTTTASAPPTPRLTPRP
ncbi:MAG: hypothetical protein U0791_09435 [Gemmataceae bacterium]